MKKVMNSQHLIIMSFVLSVIAPLKLWGQSNPPLNKTTNYDINFSCADPYFLIGGEIYYDGDNVVLCLGENTNSTTCAESNDLVIEAYTAGGTPFPENTEWVGVIQTDEGKSIISIDNVVSNPGVIIASYSGGDVAINLSFENVMFDDYENSSYGFDPIVDWRYWYFSLAPINNAPYLEEYDCNPWKSMKIGDTDNFRLKLTPSYDSNIELLTSGNVSLSTTNPTSNNTIINIGNSNSTQTTEEVVEVHGYNGNLCGDEQLNVVSLEEKTETVYFIVVHEGDQNGTMTTQNLSGQALLSLPSIQNKLDEVYSQAIFHWNVTQIGDQIVDYDENGDNKFDLNAIGGVYSNEMQNIINACSSLCNAPGKYVFIVGQETLEEDSFGWFLRTEKYGFVSSFECETIEMFNYTISHELGHSLNLSHPGDHFSSWDNCSDDLDNVMNPTHPYFCGAYHLGDRLRRYQWEMLHNE